jgi:nitrogen regulatory protein P-II 1
MKKLEAVIRPAKLVAVRDALAKAGILGMTVSDVKGSGPGEARTQCYRGVEYTVDFLAKVKVEVVLDDHVAERAAEIVRSNAYTGEPGDGSTLLLPVDAVIRIGTAERGTNAA